MNTLRPGLPPLPARLRHLPIDERGYPVPWFVRWIGGKPDHRVVDADKIGPAINLRRCWVCGGKLGVARTFCIGPMCGVNRVSAEPPSHRECIEYSVQACPFLSKPHMRRREAGLPQDKAMFEAGIMLHHNPGVTLIWTTDDVRPFNVDPPRRGVMFDFGDPIEPVRFIAEGRPATRAEIDAAIAKGLPSLQAQCTTPAETTELVRQTMLFKLLIDEAVPA